MFLFSLKEVEHRLELTSEEEVAFSMSDETSQPEPETPMTIEERLVYLEEQNEGLKTVGKLLMALSLVTAGLLVWSQMNQRATVFSESMVYENAGLQKYTVTANTGNHLAYIPFDQMGILPTEPQFATVGDLQGVVLYDQDGKPRVVIGVNSRNESVLDVLGPDGRRQFAAVPTVPPAPSQPPAPGGAQQPATPAP